MVTKINSNISELNQDLQELQEGIMKIYDTYTFAITLNTTKQIDISTIVGTDKVVQTYLEVLSVFSSASSTSAAGGNVNITKSYDASTKILTVRNSGGGVLRDLTVNLKFIIIAS